MSRVPRCQSAGSGARSVDSKEASPSLNELTDGDADLCGHLLLTVPKVADKLGLTGGYRTVVNTGGHGGQTVFIFTFTFSAEDHCHGLPADTTLICPVRSKRFSGVARRSFQNRCRLHPSSNIPPLSQD